MKKLIGILSIIFFIQQAVIAAGYDVLVLPADLLNTRENYYNFTEASEIVSNDIINDFNNSKGRINSPDIYNLRAVLSQNYSQKTDLANALSKFKSSGAIDFDALKSSGTLFNTKYIVLVSSSVVTNKNSLKRSVWEVLEIATDCDVTYPYRLETSVVLVDTSSNSVMWSNNYSTKLGANDNIFAAKNYAQANGEYEKLKLYSASVVAPSASQNIILRFYPKSINTIETKVEDTGGALRYDKRLPERPRLRDNVPYTGDMLFEF